MNILKKLVFSLIFIVCALIVPALLLLLFVDSTSSFAVYVIVYGIIIFGVLGYIIASMNELSKNFKETLEEIKKQNAAIAYKITKGDSELSSAVEPAPSEAAPAAPEKASTANVPLNPAEPLVAPAQPKAKVIDDDFDDFK